MTSTEIESAIKRYLLNCTMGQTRGEIAKQTGMAARAVGNALRRLKRRGIVECNLSAYWRLSG